MAKKKAARDIGVKKTKKLVEKQLEEKEKELEERNEKKRKEEEYKIKRLGPYKHIEHPKTVLLSNDLPDSIRKIPDVAMEKGSSVLMLDRQLSLQRRNMVEPRKKFPVRRRYEKKFYQKRWKRDPKLDELRKQYGHDI